MMRMYWTYTLCPEEIMKALVLMATAACMWTGSLVAQDPAAAGQHDALRARVAEAVARGDSVALQRAYVEVAQAKQGMPTFHVTYEELRSCGYYAQETRLECTIDIKRPAGYGGPIGSPGSFEFVSCFVDHGGNAFQASDYVGSGIVNVADGSAGTSFAIYRDFNPPGGPRTSNSGATTTTTTNGPIFRARCILSWSTPIINPNQTPFWGNVIDFRIRMMPIR
jgi:hypothetical protein